MRFARFDKSYVRRLTHFLGATGNCYDFCQSYLIYSSYVHFSSAVVQYFKLLLPALSFFFIILVSFAKALFPYLAQIAHFPALNKTVSGVVFIRLHYTRYFCQIFWCKATYGNSAF